MPNQQHSSQHSVQQHHQQQQSYGISVSNNVGVLAAAGASSNIDDMGGGVSAASARRRAPRQEPSTPSVMSIQYQQSVGASTTTTSTSTRHQQQPPPHRPDHVDAHQQQRSAASISPAPRTGSNSTTGTSSTPPEVDTDLYDIALARARGERSSDTASSSISTSTGVSSSSPEAFLTKRERAALAATSAGVRQHLDRTPSSQSGAAPQHQNSSLSSQPHRHHTRRYEDPTLTHLPLHLDEKSKDVVVIAATQSQQLTAASNMGTETAPVNNTNATSSKPAARVGDTKKSAPITNTTTIPIEVTATKPTSATGAAPSPVTTSNDRISAVDSGTTSKKRKSSKSGDAFGGEHLYVLDLSTDGDGKGMQLSSRREVNAGAKPKAPTPTPPSPRGTSASTTPHHLHADAVVAASSTRTVHAVLAGYSAQRHAPNPYADLIHDLLQKRSQDPTGTELTISKTTVSANQQHHGSSPTYRRRDSQFAPSSSVPPTGAAPSASGSVLVDQQPPLSNNYNTTSFESSTGGGGSGVFAAGVGNVAPYGGDGGVPPKSIYGGNRLSSSLSPHARSTIPAPIASSSNAHRATNQQPHQRAPSPGAARVEEEYTGANHGDDEDGGDADWMNGVGRGGRQSTSLQSNLKPKVWDRLYCEGLVATARTELVHNHAVQQQEYDLEQNQLDECTFHPNLHRSSAPRWGGGGDAASSSGVNSGPSEAFFDRLVAEGAEKRKLREKLAKKKQEDEEKKLEEERRQAKKRSIIRGATPTLVRDGGIDSLHQRLYGDAQRKTAKAAKEQQIAALHNKDLTFKPDVLKTGAAAISACKSSKEEVTLSDETRQRKERERLAMIKRSEARQIERMEIIKNANSELDSTKKKIQLCLAERAAARERLTGAKVEMQRQEHLRKVLAPPTIPVRGTSSKPHGNNTPRQTSASPVPKFHPVANSAASHRNRYHHTLDEIVQFGF